MFEFTFAWFDWLKGVGGIYKTLYFIIWDGVLINGNRGNGLIFFLRIGTAHTPSN